MNENVKTQDVASHIEERTVLLEAATAAEGFGDYDEAERVALTVLESTDPANSAEAEHYTGALLQLGIIERLRGNYPQALERFAVVLDLSESTGNRERIAKALSNIGNVHVDLSDYPRALEFHSRALAINEELNNQKGIAGSLHNIGMVHAGLSDNSRALDYYTRALAINEAIDNKEWMANNFGSIGIVHGNLSDYSKALEYFDKALSIAEKLDNKLGMATHLGNIGVVHMNLSDSAKALEYYAKALSIAEELGNKAAVAIWLGNIGSAHGNLSDNTKALEYFAKALSIAEELGNKTGVATHLGNIGDVYQTQQDYDRALEYCSRGMQIHVELGAKAEASFFRGNLGSLYASAAWPGRDEAKAEEYLLESIAISEDLGTKNYQAHKTLAELYEGQERWKESNIHNKKYHELEKEVLSEEAKKSATQMEQSKQIAEREKEIAIAKAAADAQMGATTKLLYKVLPQSIATRIIDGEEEIADYFTSVSILFADIAGFTPISADMPAIVVVRFLNFVFGEFDRIIKKHGCEKIKTIGDGYMAVCGAPITCDDHAERLASAALEMQEAIALPESIREYMPQGVKLGVRIGLHTGSIVAGVIGEERFVYDIYSDAVNTAARMESHGEENKIHVSNDFYRHLQNRFATTKNTAHGFVFEQRGEMEIKGKGKMKTYFLERLVSL